METNKEVTHTSAEEIPRLAGFLLKKYGNTREARAWFLEKAQSCEPPLVTDEIKAIWSDAMKALKADTARNEPDDPTPRKPDDYTDVGQAHIFAKHCRDHIRYSPATDYLVYDGVCWQESKSRAQGALHAFTDAQLEEAEKHLAETQKQMDENGATAIVETYGKKDCVGLFSEEQYYSFLAHEGAVAYKLFVLKRRDSKYLTATLKEARPMVEIDPSELDADGFLLNTPDYTVDIRKGLNG